MNCNKVKNTCGKKVFASCTEYQGTLSDNTTITDECYNLEEVIDDINSLIDTLFTKVDVSGLTSTCVTLIKPKTTPNVFQALLNKVCALETTITAQAGLIATMQSQIADLQTQTCP